MLIDKPAPSGKFESRFLLDQEACSVEVEYLHSAAFRCANRYQLSQLNVHPTLAGECKQRD